MKRLLPTLALMLTCGCSRAPSINVLGAFFPAWLFCLMGGLVLTLLIRSVLIKTGLIAKVGPLGLLYPALGSIFTFIFWFLFAA